MMMFLVFDGFDQDDINACAHELIIGRLIWDKVTVIKATSYIICHLTEIGHGS